MVKLKKIPNLRKVLREMHEIELSKRQRRELIQENYTCYAKWLQFDRVLEQEVTKSWAKGLKREEAYQHIIDELREYSISLSREIIYNSRE